MKNRCIRRTLSLAMGLLLVGLGIAFAHGTEKHGKMVPVDAQMKRIHAIMPMFSVALAKLETAVENGEVAAVETEVGKIIAAIPDLKKSKPHKNVKQRKLFIEYASNLEKSVISTMDLVKNGNPAGAKTAFKTVEEVCAACHATFRD